MGACLAAWERELDGSVSRDSHASAYRYSHIDGDVVVLIVGK